jgi:pimeloyl-ACP methyl ester carboxylesterase
MHDPLEQVFGNTKEHASIPSGVVVIRHGFWSNEEVFFGLAKALETCGKIDNEPYDWIDPVVVNGVRLALHISKLEPAKRPLYFVGHSMGGLVCRIAIIALSNPGALRRYLLSSRNNWNFDAVQVAQRCREIIARKVDGLVMLATPNSGAFTHGQTALLSSKIGRLLAWKVRSIEDLTSIHFFRLFQHFATSTPTLSISGSSNSGFATKLSGVHSLALNLNLPNDSIVEDSSVDLNQSILPNEITNNTSSKYLHLRAYENCTDVTHFNIYDSPNVRRKIISFIKRL